MMFIRSEIELSAERSDWTRGYAKGFKNKTSRNNVTRLSMVIWTKCKDSTICPMGAVLNVFDPLSYA